MYHGQISPDGVYVPILLQHITYLNSVSSVSDIRKKSGKTSVCFLVAVVCSRLSAWDLQALTPCCNDRGRVRACSVPSTAKFHPCSRKMFQSLSAPHLLLESLQPHSASAAEGEIRPCIAGIRQEPALNWTVRRLRGNENEIFSWSMEMPYFKHALSCFRHKHISSIIYFLSVQWQSPVLCFQTVPISGALSCLCFVSCLSQNKGLPSILSKHKERKFYYTETGLKEMSGTIGDNKKK